MKPTPASAKSLAEQIGAGRPDRNAFVVENIFTDFKPTTSGPNFHERDYDGTIRTHFLTTPLWGVGRRRPPTGMTDAASTCSR